MKALEEKENHHLSHVSGIDSLSRSQLKKADISLLAMYQGSRYFQTGKTTLSNELYKDKQSHMLDEAFVQTKEIYTKIATCLKADVRLVIYLTQK